MNTNSRLIHKMVLTLYYMVGSAPCHQVLLTARALGLELQHKTLNLMAKEQLAPEYVKINPQHTVPTLTDDDFSLWESRTISRYLVNKYGAGSSLYPQDARARAVVDQRLDFDFGTLYQRFADYFYPQIMEGKEADPAKLKKLEEALGFLDIFLDGSKYVAGSQPTIADFAIVATIATFDVVGINMKAYSNVLRYTFQSSFCGLIIIFLPLGLLSIPSRKRPTWLPDLASPRYTGIKQVYGWSGREKATADLKPRVRIPRVPQSFRSHVRGTVNLTTTKENIVRHVPVICRNHSSTDPH
nr:glutathione S-transferase delta 3 [Ectropis grisescens]